MPTIAETRVYDEYARSVPKAKVELTVGTLAGLDADGLLVPASSAVGAIVAPVTIVHSASLPYPYESTEISGSKTYAKLRAGDTLEIRTKGLLEYPLGTFTQNEVSAKTPMYLGVDGVVTKTKPVTTGDASWVVGYVYSRSLVVIDLENAIVPEIIA